MADHSDGLEAGRAAFNRGEYFLAHELWERVWHDSSEADSIHVQGLIQIAAGLHHLQKHRTRPATGLLRKGLEKLSRAPPNPPAHLHVDLLVGHVARLLVELETPETAVADFSYVRL